MMLASCLSVLGFWTGGIRAEFARKNLPQAEMLYSKAVEIRPEDATLYRFVWLVEILRASTALTAG